MTMTFISEHSPASFSVQLVGSANGPTTGLSRYAKSLWHALTEQGMKIDITGTLPPPFPRAVVRMAHTAGFDLDSFFATYPVFMPQGSVYQLSHLTSQNQASAIVFGAPKPLVITVHDVITLAGRHDPELTGYMTWYDKWFDTFTMRGLRRADALIADSAYTRQDIVRVLGFPVEKIHVVYLGVDHQSFRPTPVPVDFARRYGLADDTLGILYVGSEDPRKNVRRLIDAFAHVLKQFPQARILKVGGARFKHERDQLLQYVHARGLQNHILFFDQVSDADLVAFYNYARVFVFPSLYEGFGWPPLEAMACGTSVISSNSSSLPEVVGDAAITFDPYDVDALTAAICRVLSDADLRADLRQRGLAQAAQFTWERAARETMDVYRRVMDMHR